MKKQKYEMIGETDSGIVTVITTASTREKRMQAFRKKYPDADFIEEIQLAMYN